MRRREERKKKKRKRKKRNDRRRKRESEKEKQSGAKLLDAIDSGTIAQNLMNAGFGVTNVMNMASAGSVMTQMSPMN